MYHKYGILPSYKCVRFMPAPNTLLFKYLSCLTLEPLSKQILLLLSNIAKSIAASKGNKVLSSSAFK